MTVAEAKALAREWASERAKEMSDFAGAFLYGSICERDDDEAFPASSDIDITIVVHGPGHDIFTEVEGEYRSWAVEYGGAYIEWVYASIGDFENPHDALSSATNNSAFRTNNVLLDPTGMLATAQRAVSASYSREEWVRARVAFEENMCRWGLGHAEHITDPLPGWSDEFIERIVWLFYPGLGSIASIPSVANLGVPTFRRALPNCRAVLNEYDVRDVYEKLLETLGSAHLTKSQVTGFVDEMDDGFGLAVKYGRTSFWGLLFLQEFARGKFVGGARELVHSGFHPEAMQFLVVIRSIIQNALENDAPADVRRDAHARYRTLLSSIGVDSETDVDRRAEAMSELLPEMAAAADTITRRNEAIKRG